MASPQHSEPCTIRRSATSDSFHPKKLRTTVYHFFPLGARFYADFFSCQEESRVKVNYFSRTCIFRRCSASVETAIGGVGPKRSTLLVGGRFPAEKSLCRMRYEWRTGIVERVPLWNVYCPGP